MEQNKNENAILWFVIILRLGSSPVARFAPLMERKTNLIKSYLEILTASRAFNETSSREGLYDTKLHALLVDPTSKFEEAVTK